MATVVLCWMGMQGLHELGHILGGQLTGATLARVVWHPLTISRTDFSDNPQPLLVAWSGPWGGVVFPLILWGVLQRWEGAFVLRFFAGFCLIANGLYLGVGSFEAVGDCGDLCRHGAALWQLWLFGLLTVPAGFLLWNEQSKHFGWGPQGVRPTPQLIWTTALIAVALITLSQWFPDLS